MPTVALTGQSAVAYAGSLRIFSSDWYNFFNEQQLVIDAYSNSTNQLLGIELNAYSGIFSIPSPSWYSFYYEHQQLINANATGYCLLDGINASIDYGIIIISGTENCSIIINGIDVVSSYELPLATGESVINAELQISGIELATSISNISASVENPEIWQSSGKIKRYPANAFKNSSIKLPELIANSAQSDIYVSGTVQINATISLYNVVSFTQIADITADGILSISDNELILLMAA